MDTTLEQEIPVEIVAYFRRKCVCPDGLPDMTLIFGLRRGIGGVVAATYFTRSIAEIVVARGKDQAVDIIKRLLTGHKHYHEAERNQLLARAKMVGEMVVAQSPNDTPEEFARALKDVKDERLRLVLLSAFPLDAIPRLIELLDD